MPFPKRSPHRGACLRPSCLATMLLALGCGACNATAGPYVPAAAVTSIADRYVAAYFDAFPDQATIAGVVSAPHDRLPDLSPAARAGWQAREDAAWQALAALDVSRLPAGSPAAVTYGFLKEWVHNDRELRVCRMEWWSVSPTMNGLLATPTHAHGTEAIKMAIRAGVDSVEHSSLIDDEGIKLAKQRGTYLVFGVYNDDYILSE